MAFIFLKFVFNSDVQHLFETFLDIGGDVKSQGNALQSEFTPYVMLSYARYSNHLKPHFT
jgi:hypothetical protein